MERRGEVVHIAHVLPRARRILINCPVSVPCATADERARRGRRAPLHEMDRERSSPAGECSREVRCPHRASSALRACGRPRPQIAPHAHRSGGGASCVLGRGGPGARARSTTRGRGARHRCCLFLERVTQSGTAHFDKCLRQGHASGAPSPSIGPRVRRAPSPRSTRRSTAADDDPTRPREPISGARSARGRGGRRRRRDRCRRASCPRRGICGRRRRRGGGRASRG